MKKIKRAFALALASAMILGMFSMTASAAESANKTDGTADSPITELTVKKVLSTNGNKGVTLPTESFFVQMVPATESEINGAVFGKTDTFDGYAIQPGVALANPVLEFKFDASNKTNTGSATETSTFNIAQFESTGFTKAGVYRYYITEVIQNKAEDGTVSYSEPPTQDDENVSYYIKYDHTKYTVDLIVSSSSTGYYVSAVSVQKNEETEKPKAIEFDNQINCANITITKAIDGDPFDADEDFTFHILIPEKGDTIKLEGVDKITAVKYDKDGHAYDGTITLDVKGADINADVETNGTKFTLKDGESLVITAPVSMIYKVHEDDYSSEGYTTSAEYGEYGNFAGSTTLNADDNITTETVTKEDGTKVSYVTVRGTTNTAKNTVNFTNKRDDPTVSTGINLDFIPYVVVLALVVAAGSVLLVYKKKKTVR
jgi:hypothetical protein